MSSEISRLLDENHKLQARVDELQADNEKINALKDRLDHGIKYDKKLNLYTVRWTKLELEAAALQANEIYENLHWTDSPMPPEPKP